MAAARVVAALTEGLPAQSFGEFYDCRGTRAIAALVGGLDAEESQNGGMAAVALTQLLGWPPNRAQAAPVLVDSMGRGGHGREHAGRLLWGMGQGSGMYTRDESTESA